MEIGKYILLSILLPIRETTYSSAVTSIICLSFTLCVIIPTGGQNQLFHSFVFHNITVFGLFIKGAISVLLPQLGSVCMSKNSPACCIYLRPERRCWGSDSSVCCTVLLHAQQLKSIERTRKRIAYYVANLIWTQTIG